MCIRHILQESLQISTSSSEAPPKRPDPVTSSGALLGYLLVCFEGTATAGKHHKRLGEQIKQSGGKTLPCHFAERLGHDIHNLVRFLGGGHQRRRDADPVWSRTGQQ